MKKIRLRMAGNLSLIALTVLLGIISAEKIQAQSSISLRVAPLNYDLDASLGEEKIVDVYVENISDSEVQIDAEFSDFFIDEGGGYIFSVDKNVANEDLRPYLMKDWLSAGQSGFSIGAGEGKTLSVKIAVPENAVLGGHYGAVFFRTKCEVEKDQAVSATDKSTLCISGRVGVLFLLRVGGDGSRSAKLEKLNVPAVSFKDAAEISIEIKNSGNTHFRPEGILSVKDIRGKEMQRIEIKDKTVLPTRSVSYADLVKKGDFWGVYKIEGTIKDGDDNEIRLVKRIFMIPWREIIIILGILAGWIWFIRRFKISRKNR